MHSKINEYETIVKSDAIYLDASALVKIDKDEGDSSRFVRILVYSSDIKIFSSWVGFGEIIGIYGRKKIQKRIGLANYLHNCRSIMKDYEINKIYRIEPPSDRYKFIKLANDCLVRYANLGGGDIWHLMAVIELINSYPSTLLFSYDKELVKAARSENINVVYGTNLVPETLIEALKSSNRWIPNKT